MTLCPNLSYLPFVDGMLKILARCVLTEHHALTIVVLKTVQDGVILSIVLRADILGEIVHLNIAPV